MASKKSVNSPMDAVCAIPNRKSGGYDYPLGPKQDRGKATIATHPCDHQVQPSPSAIDFEASTCVKNPKYKG